MKHGLMKKKRIIDADQERIHLDLGHTNRKEEANNKKKMKEEDEYKETYNKERMISLIREVTKVIEQVQTANKTRQKAHKWKRKKFSDDIVAS